MGKLPSKILDIMFLVFNAVISVLVIITTIMVVNVCILAFNSGDIVSFVIGIFLIVILTAVFGSSLYTAISILEEIINE